MTRIHIRWMIRRDMPSVLAIERASFAYPWNEDEFLSVLRAHHHIGYVAEHRERPVGFFIYELHKGRIHILDFAVHPDFRRQGVGRQMVAKLVGKLSEHRRTRITLDVRETNLDGQLFWRRQGFLATETLREHFADSGEDAIAMEYALEEAATLTMAHHEREC